MGAHFSSLRSCAQFWSRLFWALISLPFAAALSSDLSNCCRSSLSFRSFSQLWSRLIWALISLPFAAALSSDLGCCWRSLLIPSQLRSVMILVIVGAHFSFLRRCAQFWSRLLWALVSLPFAGALSSDIGCFGCSLHFPSHLSFCFG